MKISKVIKSIKESTSGIVRGEAIDPSKTRDQVLFGDTGQQCTGVVVAMWPSVEVLRHAVKRGANLIICHEALFWNHGDHTDWLESVKNKVYVEKKELLEKNHLTVWRDHDYLHSGIPTDAQGFQDGIFWGFAKAMAWENPSFKDGLMEVTARLPEPLTVGEIVKVIIRNFGLKGARIIGSLDTKVRKIGVIPHVLGDARSLITQIEKENFDLILSMEVVDYTLGEYMRDASQLEESTAMISIGHFNLEEIGLLSLTDYFRETIDESISVDFVKTGDMYDYVDNAALNSRDDDF